MELWRGVRERALWQREQDAAGITPVRSQGSGAKDTDGRQPPSYQEVEIRVENGEISGRWILFGCVGLRLAPAR